MEMKLLSEVTHEDRQIVMQDFQSICLSLENLNGVFAQFYELGRPTVTYDVDTAAVSFNKEGACIDFLINPAFWRLLNFDTKLFLICHECLHVILDHGKRSSKSNFDKDTTGMERQLTNIAMDVVINETIVGHFGIRRDSLNFGEAFDIQHPEGNGLDDDHPAQALSEIKHGAFLDTVFHKIKPDIKPKKSYEYYNDVLIQYFKEEISEAKDQQQAMREIADALSKMSKDDHEKLAESMAEGSGKDMKSVVSEIMENADRKDLEDLSDALTENFGKGNPGDPLIAGSLERVIQQDYRKVKKLKRWQDLFRKFVRKTQDKQNTLQWIHADRRRNLLPSKYLLPSKNRANGKDNRYLVWLFIDSSGSCEHLKDQFFKAAYSLDPKYFNVRLFSRTTEVKELDYKNPVVTGYGSDDYGCIERYIQQQLSSRSIDKYPEIVIHFTDGYDCSGVMVQPEKPLNWFWFLTDEMYTDWIPKKCIEHNRVFKLSEFES